MIKIIAVPKNPLTMTPAEIQPLLDDLKGEFPELQTKFVARQQRGYQVGLWEALTLYVQHSGADALKALPFELLLGGIVHKVKGWLKRRRQTKGVHRPFALTIRDHKGKLLCAFDIKPGDTIQLIEAQRAAIEKLPSQRDTRRERRERAREEDLAKAVESDEAGRMTVLACDIANSHALVSKAFPAAFPDWLDACRDKWQAVIEKKTPVAGPRSIEPRSCRLKLRSDKKQRR